MRKMRIALFVVMAMCFPALAMAAGTACGTPVQVCADGAGGKLCYSFLSTSVGSSSTPACVMPVDNNRTSYSCVMRSTDATPVLFWQYVGTVPASVATNTVERAAGGVFEDSCSSGGPCTEALSAALTTGSTASLVDCWWKSTP